MATIGTFKKSGNEYTGEIVTLNVQAKNVRIVPETNQTSENAPSHRVLVGRAEIGAAWSKQSNEGRDYLGLKLDDPSFTAPIYALRGRRRRLQPHLVPSHPPQRRVKPDRFPPGRSGRDLFPMPTESDAPSIADCPIQNGFSASQSAEDDYYSRFSGVNAGVCRR